MSNRRSNDHDDGPRESKAARMFRELAERIVERLHIQSGRTREGDAPEQAPIVVLPPLEEK